jgi:hypothetical protein
MLNNAAWDVYSNVKKLNHDQMTDMTQDIMTGQYMA